MLRYGGDWQVPVFGCQVASSGKGILVELPQPNLRSPSAHLYSRGGRSSHPSAVSAGSSVALNSMSRFNSDLKWYGGDWQVPVFGCQVASSGKGILVELPQPNLRSPSAHLYSRGGRSSHPSAVSAGSSVALNSMSRFNSDLK
ncbi:hypothetical protein HGM15179_016672, partial [Zosterops borbonicus]